MAYVKIEKYKQKASASQKLYHSNIHLTGKHNINSISEIM